jgi:hypothetical protein
MHRPRATASLIVATAAVALLLAACGSGDGSGGSADQASGSGDAATSGEFSALTYNVAGLPQLLSGSNPEEYMPLIGPLLNDYDLVLTQEDFANPVPNDSPFQFFHEVLLDTTNHPYRPEAMAAPLGANPDRPSAFTSDGLNMFSRFPVGPLTRVAWPDCFGGADTSDRGAGDCLAVKGFTHSRVTLADGAEIDVYNLHGEAGSTPADVEAARTGFALLGEYIVANSAGRAVLLGGDTNLNADKPGDAAVWDAFLATTGLADICATVECPDEPGSIDKFAFRGSADLSLEPLDRVVEYEKFTAPGRPELNDGQLSDHRAISSRWRWTLLR